MSNHTPGYVSMGKWNVMSGDALIYFGHPKPDATDVWAFASWLGFRNEADAREFIKRWNSHEELLAACKAVMEFLSNGTPVHPGALVQAEVFNAIRKAEGRT